MATKTMTFNEIPSGRKFRVPTGIVYQKISTRQAKPVQQVDGTVIKNGLVTTSFYNSKLQMTVIS